jgi:hypothetical protein
MISGSTSDQVYLSGNLPIEKFATFGSVVSGLLKARAGVVLLRILQLSRNLRSDSPCIFYKNFTSHALTDAMIDCATKIDRSASRTSL